MKTLLKQHCYGLTFALVAQLAAVTLGFAALPTANIAIIGDPHLYSTRLGASGSALEHYMAEDPKMLVQSEAIVDAALQGVVENGANIVLIPGDLTKDGETFNHVRMAQKLTKLEKHGVKVYVVPGNHDINNSDSVRFKGDRTHKMPSASPKVFEALYKRFGFSEAISRDRHSLSYLAEPVPGLWLLAIDACRYEDSRKLGYPVVGGEIKPETLEWVLATLERAQARNKQVIAFMHHGLNPNFVPQPMLFADWLVDDYQALASTLANAGLKVIFTGHYHNVDIALPFDMSNPTAPTAWIWDVETPSLATYPSAYRLAALRDGVLNITTRRITEIDADTDGKPFQQFAADFLWERLPPLTSARLQSDFGLPAPQAQALAPWIADALMAQYDGDEQITAEALQFVQYLGGQGEPYATLGQLLYGLWMDIPPGDNTATIPLVMR